MLRRVVSHESRCSLEHNQLKADRLTRLSKELDQRLTRAVGEDEVVVVDVFARLVRYVFATALNVFEYVVDLVEQLRLKFFPCLATEVWLLEDLFDARD